MLVDKIIIERHPSKIDKGGRRHYLIRAIPYQDPQQETERLTAAHDARIKIVPDSGQCRRDRCSSVPSPWICSADQGTESRRRSITGDLMSKAW
jgi:hypothetical protein